MSKLKFDVCKAKAEHMAFISHSWRRSYIDSMLRWSSEASHEIRQRIHALERRKAEFFVAVDPWDSNHIYGFACVKDGVLHYAYTKEIYRDAGVMSALIEGRVGSPVHCSHFTPIMEEVALKSSKVYVFSPSSREHFKPKRARKNARTS